VVWKWQRNGKDKWTKPPFYAPEPVHRAANNRPTTWSTHHAAVAAVLQGRANGIGFVLTGTKVAAVDLDKCRDPESGVIDHWAQQILDAAPTAYREITVSGTGLRVIGIASGPETHRRFNIAGREGAGLEVYRRATDAAACGGAWTTSLAVAGKTNSNDIGPDSPILHYLRNIEAKLDRLNERLDKFLSARKKKRGARTGDADNPAPERCRRR